jgi:carbon monoxide dehydrogenase subunit G
MELSNEFTVGVPVDEAWKVLTDVERIAPCLPGAQLQEVEGDEYRGIVKIKVGPITAQYKGTARFQEKDDDNHVAVLRAEGRDTRGAGNASATITATLVPEGEGTKVTVLTDLTVTGKVAQFGRGVLADVSGKLMTQFAEALDAEVRGGGPTADAPAPEAPAPEAPAPATAAAVAIDGPGADAPAAGTTPAATTPAPEAPPATSGIRKIDSKPAQPVDLLDAAGSPVAKRVGPIVGVVVVLLWLLRRRRKKTK